MRCITMGNVKMIIKSRDKFVLLVFVSFCSSGLVLLETLSFVEDRF